MESAFAAYKSTAKKENKKSAKKSTSGDSTKTKPKASNAKSKAASSNGAKPKGTTTKATATKAKTESTVKATNGVKPKAAGKTTNGATSKKAAATKAKATSAAKKSTTTTTKAKSTAQTRTKLTNGIKPEEVDGLVEKLLVKSPSKLTKAELKKKKELEAYLVKELEKNSSTEVETDTSSGSDSDSDSDDDSSDEDDSDDDDSDDDDGEEEEDSEEEGEDEDGSSFSEFSDEYTLNSYSEETTDKDGENDDKNTAAAKAKETAQKRKNQEENAADLDKNNADAKSSNTDSKKRKQVEEKSTARKSLPATMVEKTQAKAKRNTIEPQSATTMTVAAGTVTTSSQQNNDKNKPVKLEPLSPPANVVHMNSIDEGLKVFRWLLNPVGVDDFFAKYWERSTCLIKRQQQNYYSNLISFDAIDQMLLKHHVEFTKNIDVTSYKNGVRETLNPEGRALPPTVWDHYGQGCSIRLLNPQTFLPQLFAVNTTLQEYFHCLVGANAYLTPPNSQGFAPHYDDIEAFVLQVEGCKRWKLYMPRNQSEMLPRYSSTNFTQSEIGKPFLEEVLHPGDLLYFPRGTIHQALTEPGHHSLHITLSVYQKQSIGDLFEQMFPIIVQRAIAKNLDLRRGLPLNVWQHAGVAHSDSATKERADFQTKISQLLSKCMRDINLPEVVDAAVDQLAKRFQHEALPPEILPSERVRTIFGSRSRTNEHGDCVCDYEIDLRTNVRLLRANILRLVEEDQKVHIYYYLDNSKQFCEYEPNCIEIEPIEAGSVEVLIKSYPAYIGVSQLPLDDDERKIQIAAALWERGLLMMEQPFK